MHNISSIDIFIVFVLPIAHALVVNDDRSSSLHDAGLSWEQSARNAADVERCSGADDVSLIQLKLKDKHAASNVEQIGGGAASECPSKCTPCNSGGDQNDDTFVGAPDGFCKHFCFSLFLFGERDYCYSEPTTTFSTSYVDCRGCAAAPEPEPEEVMYRKDKAGGCKGKIGKKGNKWLIESGATEDTCKAACLDDKGCKFATLLKKGKPSKWKCASFQKCKMKKNKKYITFQNANASANASANFSANNASANAQLCCTSAPVEVLIGGAVQVR
jgi:hypothetical protein